MGVLNNIKAQLQISDTPSTILKSNDTKNAVIINVTTCTWDEDIKNEENEDNTNENNQDLIQDEYNDTIMPQKDIDIFNIADSAQIEQQQQVYDYKFMPNDINFFTLAEIAQKLDLNYQNENLKLLLQQQQLLLNGINSNSNDQLQLIPNIASNTFSFDNTFIPPENTLFNITNSNNKGSYFTFNPVWGPVGGQVNNQQQENKKFDQKMGIHQNGIYNLDRQEQNLCSEEEEFNTLSKLIIAYNIANYLRIPRTKLENMTQQIFKSLIYNKQISEYSYSKYVFEDEWMLEFLDNYLFTEEEKEIIIQAARNSFKEKGLLYVDMTPYCFDLLSCVVDKKIQLQEVQTIFTMHPNHQKQRKRSSHSLQSTNHSSLGGELADLEEGKHNEENNQHLKKNIDLRAQSQNKSVKTKQNVQSINVNEFNTNKVEQTSQSSQNSKPKNTNNPVKNPLTANNQTEKPQQEKSKESQQELPKPQANQNQQKLELGKSSSSKVPSVVQSKVPAKSSSSQILQPVSNKANGKSSQFPTQESDQLKKKQEAEKQKLPEDDFVSIQPKGVLKLEYDEKKKERIDNNMFTFLENEQEEDEEKEENKAKNENSAHKKQKIKAKQPEKTELKKQSKKVSQKLQEQLQQKEEKKKRQEELQLLNEQLNLMKQEKEKNKLKLQEQKQQEAQQQEVKKKQKEQQDKHQQEFKKLDDKQKMDPEMFFKKEVQVFSQFMDYSTDSEKIKQNLIKCLESNGLQQILESTTIKNKDKKKKKKSDKIIESVPKEFSHLISAEGMKISQKYADQIQIKGQVNQKIIFQAESSVYQINSTTDTNPEKINKINNKISSSSKAPDANTNQKNYKNERHSIKKAQEKDKADVCNVLSFLKNDQPIFQGIPEVELTED